MPGLKRWSGQDRATLARGAFGSNQLNGKVFNSSDCATATSQPEVLAIVLIRPGFREEPGSEHSRTHRFGWSRFGARRLTSVRTSTDFH